MFKDYYTFENVTKKIWKNVMMENEKMLWPARNPGRMFLRKKIWEIPKFSNTLMLSFSEPIDSVSKFETRKERFVFLYVVKIILSNIVGLFAKC